MINIDGTIWLWKIQNWYKVSLYHLFSIIKPEKAKSCGHLAIFGHDFQNEAIWNNILKNASKIIFIKEIEKGFCKRLSNYRNAGHILSSNLHSKIGLSSGRLLVEKRNILAKWLNYELSQEGTGFNINTTSFVHQPNFGVTI